MAKNKKLKSCEWYPMINDQPSKMYKDLLKTFKLGRPLVNYLYSSYVTSPDVADAMDKVLTANGKPKYRRNYQGEHSAASIMDYFNVYQMIDDVTNMSLLEASAGFSDSYGNKINFTDAKKALEDAEAFNKKHPGLVASVISRGDEFQVNVYQKNAKTSMYGVHVTKQLKVWDIEKQAFAAKGLDIEALPQELKSTFNPTQLDLVQILMNLQNLRRDYMYKRDALLLFNLDPSSPPIQRIINSFGSIEAAAQAIYDINGGSHRYTSAEQILLDRAINHSKQFLQSMDLQSLKDEVDQTIEDVVRNSPEAAAQKTLHELNKKYKIDVEEIIRDTREIKTLSDAAADAVVLIERRIREIERQFGQNQEGKRLEDIRKLLVYELQNKRYYFGLLKFLAEAQEQVGKLEDILQDVQQSGSNMDILRSRISSLQKARQIKTQYWGLVSALSDERLTIDEAIGQYEIGRIREEANKIKNTLKKYFREDNILPPGKVDEIIERTVIDLVKEQLGPTGPNGESIVNIVQMASVDASYLDWLYSIGDASNPMIAAMGKIIRRAQDARDVKMSELSSRLRKITHRLYKSGSNSKYMYADQTHILSDIDWIKYDYIRIEYSKSLWGQRLSPFEYKEAMEDWVEQNTVERVVDRTTGRTERVPNENYRLDNGLVWDDVNHVMMFTEKSGLTPEQQEYYIEAMQIKGEIGSYLPYYAQKQYLPPQVRRKFLQSIREGDIWKALKNKALDPFVIREDDERYYTNGIIEGEEFQNIRGDYNNTQLKQIPIFYINEVEQGELLRNFSAGLTRLASTAINYDAMNSIRDTVEFLWDFIKNKDGGRKKHRQMLLMLMKLIFVKRLWKKAKILIHNI